MGFRKSSGFVFSFYLITLVFSPVSLAQQTIKPDPATRQLAHDIFKQLIEINTTDSVGSVTAASEAMAFAAAQGLDLARVYEVITKSAGNSWMFENRMPHVLDGDYTPRSAVDIFVKDLGIIQDMARSAKFPVPVSAAALQMFLMTSASGMGRDDDASVARMYAKVTGTHLPGEPK